MEEKNRNEGVLLTDWPWRLAVLLIGFALYLTVAFSDVIASTYLKKMVISCSCLAAIGFVGGFQPRPENREQRRFRINAFILAMCASFIQTAAFLSGLYEHPASERYALMLKLPYLATYLLLVVSTTSSFFAGRLLFARIHPG